MIVEVVDHELVRGDLVRAAFVFGVAGFVAGALAGNCHLGASHDDLVVHRSLLLASPPPLTSFALRTRDRQAQTARSIPRPFHPNTTQESVTCR